jgi:hypothetical protein
MNITEVELRKLTFAVQATIAREYAFEGSTVLHARVDFLTGNMVLDLRAHVLGKTIGTPHVEYPATWWDALKRRWFPAWLLSRFPALMTTVDLEVFHTFPNMAVPQERHAVVYTRPSYGWKTEPPTLRDDE